MTTPARIAQAAVTMFGRYGFRQVNMEMIAQEAGLSRQALYRHFSNKEELFTAVATDLHRSALEASEAAAAAATRDSADLAGILHAKLEARFITFLEQLQSTPHAAELTDESGRLAGTIAADYNAKFHESVTRVIRSECHANGLALSGNLTASELAYLIIAAARGLKTTHPTPPLPEYKKLLKQMVTLIVAGALSRPAAAASRPSSSRHRSSKR